jgi:hypothetical protein
MRYVVILAVLFVLAPSMAQATIYVPDDHPTIQGAIDAAVHNETIVVRPGTYVENIFFRGKDIVVHGQLGAAATVIDGNRSGSVVSFTGREPHGTVLEGFTITNGTGTPVPSSQVTEGGGVYCFYQCNATIRNNVITDNEATNGAGIASLYSSPNIYGNTIVSNRATLYGGGIFCADPGMPRIVSNVFAGNRAVRGGAMHIESASPLITGNTFYGNSATEGGGAISCILTPNVHVKNCILWGDKASMGAEILIDYGADLTISHSVIPPGSSSVYIMPWGGILHWGDGMIETDPRLVDPEYGDFHIEAGSPCRNSGDSQFPLGFELDFEGDPRPYQEARDMGADEFHPHLYLLGDPVPGGRITLHAVGEPLSSGLKLLQGNSVRVPPLQTAYGDFYLTLPLAGIFKMGLIPPKGVRTVVIDIPVGVQPGDVFFFQALTGTNTADPALTNLLVPCIR